MSFVLSKLLWAFLSPGSLLAFLLAGGMVLSVVPRFRAVKTGRFLCWISLSGLLAIAVLPVGEWALAPLENRTLFNPPEQVDGVIIIGGDEKTEVSETRGQPTALDSMRRYVVVAELARRYPNARLVFSGGSGRVVSSAQLLDSEVARKVMTSIGVPTDRMVFERKSRNTYENAVFTADIIHPDPSQKWLLVTNAWHMPRALGCFRRAGWNISAAPAGYYTTGRYGFSSMFEFAQQIHMLTLAEHEYIGLVSYWLMGRTSALWPQ